MHVIDRATRHAERREMLRYRRSNPPSAQCWAVSAAFTLLWIAHLGVTIDPGDLGGLAVKLLVAGTMLVLLYLPAMWCLCLFYAMWLGFTDED